MDDLRERVEAVERALTDGDGDLTALAEGAAAAERVETLEAEVADLREDVAELSAATQALRGYVGNVRSVNECVEERAETALAAVESLEDRLDARDAIRDGTPGRDSTGATASADGGPTRSAEHGRTRPHEEVQRGEESGQCRACGQPTDGTTPNDPRETRTATGRRIDRTAPGESARVDGRANRERIDGFDPGRTGPGVTVREASENPDRDRRGAPADADDDPGLVGRMQNLL
jgi:uncharacterized protein (UPF0335 family)